MSSSIKTIRLIVGLHTNKIRRKNNCFLVSFKEIYYDTQNSIGAIVLNIIIMRKQINFRMKLIDGVSIIGNSEEVK